MSKPSQTTHQEYRPSAVQGWVNDIKRIGNMYSLNYDDLIDFAHSSNIEDTADFQNAIADKFNIAYGKDDLVLNNLSRNLLKLKNYTTRFYGNDETSGNPKNTVAYGNRNAVLKDTHNPFSQYYGGTPAQQTVPSVPTTPAVPTNPVNPTTPTTPITPVAPVEQPVDQEDYTTSLNKINSLYDRWSQNMKFRQLMASNFGKQVAAKPLIEPIHEVVGHDLNRRQARRTWNGKQVRLGPGQGRQTLDRWEGYGYWNTPKHGTGHVTMRYQRQMPVFDSTGAVSQNQMNNTNLDMTGYLQAQTGTTGSSSGSLFTPTSWNPVLANLQVQASTKQFNNTMNNMKNSFKRGGKFINWVNIPSARRGARLMPIAQAGGKPWRGAPQDGSVWGGAGQTIPDWYDPNAFMYPGYRDPNMPAYDSPGIHQIIGPDYEWDPEAQTRERIDMAMRNDAINAQLAEDAAYRDMMYQAGRLPKGQLETSVPQGGLAYPDNYGAMGLTKRQARRTYNGKKVKYNGNQVQLNKGRGYGYWNVPRGGMVSNTPEQMRAAGFSF